MSDARNVASCQFGRELSAPITDNIIKDSKLARRKRPTVPVRRLDKHIRLSEYTLLEGGGRVRRRGSSMSVSVDGKMHTQYSRCM